MVFKQLRRLAVAMIFLLGAGLAGGLWCLSMLQTPITIAEDSREFVVERGASIAQIAENLAARQIIQWPKVWRAYIYLVENKSLKAGEYRFAERQSPLGILQQFQRGDVIIRNITFPEGRTFKEWLEILGAEPKLKHELANKTPDEQKKLLQFGYENLEGWFFPDTYQFQAGDSDREILQRAHKKMQQVLEKLWRGREEKLPYQSAADALTLASIVEKETGTASERTLIAGVFVRRLQANMRLQTDPTVIYGLGDAYNGNITQKDLQQPTPYNTYVITGLPPSPIANPGEEALYAVLHPAPGDSLYFVAKGDGSHVFSATLEQHAKAVALYQRSNRSEQYRSSPK